METVRIQTTQNVRIDYDLATLGDRFFAWLIDYLIILAYGITLFFIITNMVFSGENITDNHVAIALLLFSIPVFCYHVFFEIFMNGQTPGKRALRIKVVKLDGSQPSIGAYLMRWLSRIIEFSLLPGLAMFAYMFSLKGQRIGDRGAGTTVVRLRKKVTLEDTALEPVPEGYIPVYPQVRLLSHRDMETIKEVFRFTAGSHDYIMMAELNEKLKKVLNVEHNVSYREFMETVITDFNYYQQQ